MATSSYERRDNLSSKEPHGDDDRIKINGGDRRFELRWESFGRYFRIGHRNI